MIQMSFKFLKTNFSGDPNIGLYGFATDSYCFLGFEPSKKILEKIKSILGVKVKIASVAGTDLIGIFCAGNSNGILLPKIIEDYELKRLKGMFEINLSVLKSKETALGNMILCNDKGCLISRDLRRFKQQISDCLDCEVEIGEIARMDIVGSAAKTTSVGCLCHRNAKEDEIKLAENLLKVKVDIGTVGYGNPFIKSGIIVNSKGILTSKQTTGPELDRIFEVFK